MEMSNSKGDPDALACRNSYGDTLVAHFPLVRVHSSGRLTVPVAGVPPFMIGVEPTIHGLVVDLSCPFLEQIQRKPPMFEGVAMNPRSLAAFGSIRVLPEDEAGTSWGLELRHQVHAKMLTNDWLLFYADVLPKVSRELTKSLGSMFGGVPTLSVE